MKHTQYFVNATTSDTIWGKGKGEGGKGEGGKGLYSLADSVFTTSKSTKELQDYMV